MTRPNRTRTAARSAPSTAAVVPSSTPGTRVGASADPPAGGPTVPVGTRVSGAPRRPGPHRPGRRTLSRRTVFLAAVSVGCLALAVWSFGRAAHRADTRLPLPEVVDGAVPVVWQGAAHNFTALGKIAGPGQGYLVGDPTTVDDGTGPLLRIDVALDHTTDSWGGWMFTHGYFPRPDATSGRPDWGAHPRSGYDLSGATVLTVVARGERGGERVEVFVAGQGYDPTSGLATADWPDSANKVSQTITLTDRLATYTVDLRGTDLSYVGNGLGLTVTAAANPDRPEVVVDLADVRFELPDAAQAITSRADDAEQARRTDLGIGWATLLAAAVGAVGLVVATWMRTRRGGTT